VDASKAAAAAGFLVCAAFLAAGQAAVGAWAPPGTKLDAGAALDVGYTFTGLTAALGYALWRWGRAGAAAGRTAAGHWRRRLLQAVAASPPALFACLYSGVAGPGAELHARAFAALPPALYLLAVAGGCRGAKG
jgi:hypothetical protein